jgi:hypothetical protein
MTNDKKNYSDFTNFIIRDDHPCVMAQSVFELDHVDLHTYTGFGSKTAAVAILEDLKVYIANYDFDSNDFYTFLAIFEDEGDRNEQQFEDNLWQQLGHLHEADDQEWDKQVSQDPKDEGFSFSLAGRAFYIVGLHTNSSRRARQAPHTAMAFNLHWQFERLREMGTYKRVRDTIRRRDRKLQGGINPMLADYGTHSEARQYSGRQIDPSWECPFSHQKGS